MSSGVGANQVADDSATSRLTPEIAALLARTALAAVRREYPNKLDHVLSGDADLLPPRDLHPAFYGSYDWHSSVHGHWLLARLIRLRPDLPEADRAASVLDEHLTPDRIAIELGYLARPDAAAFERTYGWAWLLKLAEELSRPGFDAAQRWSAAIAPLARAFVDRFLEFLPKLTYPVRSGTHGNTAFALGFAYDYAAALGITALRDVVEERARAYFADDEAYPAHLEPSGFDFLSPALSEADIMRRVLPAGEFAAWFRRFLPDADTARPETLFRPVRVSDRADAQIVHLDGLNLSRAWQLRNIAAALPEADPTRDVLSRAAERHEAASLPHVASGEYVGEHWLATFAMLALTGER